MAKKSRRRYRKKTKTRKRKNVIRGGISLTPLKTAILAYLFKHAQNDGFIKPTTGTVTADEQYRVLNGLDNREKGDLNIGIQNNPPDSNKYPVLKDHNFKDFDFDGVFLGEQNEKTIDMQEEAQRREKEYGL